MKGDRDPGWIYRVRVRKSFKGTARGVVEVYTSNTDIRFPLEVGSEYVLFADDWHRGALEIGTPTNSGPIPKRPRTLAALAQLQQGRRGGEISGQVFLDRGSIRTFRANVSVTGTTNRSAITDKNGRFRILVAPGEYKVRLGADGWIVSPFDFSYEDPDSIKIQNGQCADIWFQAAPGKKEP